MLTALFGSVEAVRFSNLTLLVACWTDLRNNEALGRRVLDRDRPQWARCSACDGRTSCWTGARSWSGPAGRDLPSRATVRHKRREADKPAIGELWNRLEPRVHHLVRDAGRAAQLQPPLGVPLQGGGHAADPSSLTRRAPLARPRDLNPRPLFIRSMPAALSWRRRRVGGPAPLLTPPAHPGRSGPPGPRQPGPSTAASATFHQLTSSDVVHRRSPTARTALAGPATAHPSAPGRGPR